MTTAAQTPFNLLPIFRLLLTFCDSGLDTNKRMIAGLPDDRQEGPFSGGIYEASSRRFSARNR